MTTSKKKVVDANIVHDSTDTAWRRVPILALILVMLYFVVAGQIQAAQNAESIKHLSTAQGHLLDTVKRDEGYVILASQYINAQQKALKEANARLKAAGLKPVQLPPPPTPPRVPKQARQAVNGGGAQPQPTPSPSGHSHPSPHPSHSPSPHPSPSGSPPVQICTDVPVLGRHCLPPTMFIGVIYVLIR